MSPETTTFVVVGICALTAIGFWAWLVAAPVVRSFSTSGQRAIAAVLSVYTLLIGLGVGAGLGLIVAYNWDRIAPLLR